MQLQFPVLYALKQKARVLSQCISYLYKLMDEAYYKSATLSDSYLKVEKIHFSKTLNNLWLQENDNSDKMDFQKWQGFRQKVWDINASCHIAGLSEGSQNQISVLKRQQNSLKKEYNFKGTLFEVIQDACIYFKEDLRACLVATKKCEDPNKSDIRRNIFSC